MMRDMDGRALPPPSIAFSGRRSDKGVLGVNAGGDRARVEVFTKVLLRKSIASTEA